MGFTIEPGTAAPDFSLPGVDGRTWTLADFVDAPILVVLFTCNHCPYVTGSEERMLAFQNEYAPRGLRMVGINSNWTQNHPNDSFDHMVTHAKDAGLNFPYLRDESQDVARAYGAQRTPHYFVFGADRRLAYSGRMDDSPRDASKAMTRELRDAVDALLAGQPVPVAVTDAIGCNVKWANHEEHWMPSDACDFLPDR